MNAVASTRSRLLLFAGLYFAQGVPWGFVTVAIMLRLATLGMGPAGLGRIGSIALLPWIAKPLFGLLVDRVAFGRFGRRRPYILLAQVGMAISLFALSFSDPMASPFPFGVLLFLHNLCAAAQDVGTDALAIDILPEHERGRANGFMSAGKWAGVLVGGQGLLALARLLGWTAAYATAIALLLLPAALVLGVREPQAVSAPAPHVRGVLRLLSRRLVLVAALFALVVDAGDGFLFPLIYPLFTQQLHFSEQQVATLATIGSAVSALAGIAGGTLSDRLGRRRTLVLGCLAVAGFYLVFLLAHGLWGSYLFQVGYAATSAAATGVVYATTVAFFMDLTHPRLVATHFQLSMALLSVRTAWGNRVGGRLAETTSARAMFGLGALVEILPLVLLLALDPRKARASLATEPIGKAEP